MNWNSTIDVFLFAVFGTMLAAAVAWCLYENGAYQLTGFWYGLAQ